MTAPRVIGSSLGIQTVGANTSDINGLGPPCVLLPANSLADGHLLLYLNGWDGDAGAITPPTGFGAITGITNGVHASATPTLGCFSKVASSEPVGTSYVSSWVNGEHHVAGMLAIDGHNGINIAARAEGTNAAPIAPTVTTTVDNCLIVQGVVYDSEREPHLQNDGVYTLKDYFSCKGPSAGASLFGGTRIQAAAGATGTFTFAIAATDEWIAFTIAIAPGPWLGNPIGLPGNMRGGMQ